MREGIRPLYPGSVVVGRAHTMLMVDVYEPEEDTFALQIEGIDRLRKDDVMVVASNRSTEAALWGSSSRPPPGAEALGAPSSTA
jgi:regulator of RNase E activity RraA